MSPFYYMLAGALISLIGLCIMAEGFYLMRPPPRPLPREEAYRAKKEVLGS